MLNRAWLELWREHSTTYNQAGQKVLQCFNASRAGTITEVSLVYVMVTDELAQVVECCQEAICHKEAYVLVSGGTNA
jgi:hypothetical protein